MISASRFTIGSGLRTSALEERHAPGETKEVAGDISVGVIEGVWIVDEFFDIVCRSMGRDLGFLPILCRGRSV